MADEKKLSAAEIRKTIATALAAAFGFIIALVWNNVVQGGLKVAGVNISLDTIDFGSWAVYLVTAIVLTVVMVVLIIVFGRWGNK